MQLSLFNLDGFSSKNHSDLNFCTKKIQELYKVIAYNLVNCCDMVINQNVPPKEKQIIQLQRARYLILKQQGFRVDKKIENCDYGQLSF